MVIETKRITNNSVYALATTKTDIISNAITQDHHIQSVTDSWRFGVVVASFVV